MQQNYEHTFSKYCSMNNIFQGSKHSNFSDIFFSHTVVCMYLFIGQCHGTCFALNANISMLTLPNLLNTAMSDGNVYKPKNGKKIKTPDLRG